MRRTCSSEYISEGDNFCPVSGCIGRIGEKFDVESCLGKQNSSLKQQLSSELNKYSTVL